MVIHSVFLATAFDIVLYLGTVGIVFAPTRIGFKGEAIEMRRHVAGNTRIGIFTPGSAYLFRFFIYFERCQAGFLELDSHAQS